MHDTPRLTQEQKDNIRKQAAVGLLHSESVVVERYCHFLSNANITLNPPLKSCPLKA